jgi:Rrf2 family transcriptional regulator, cysteine metabolism repressor
MIAGRIGNPSHEAATPSTVIRFERLLPARTLQGRVSGSMKISAKAEYACLAVLALAQQGPDASPLHIRDISREHGIPERYLVQILLQLKGAGLVASTRGSAGGYRLARAASSISLSEVLIAVNGPDSTSADSSAPRRPSASVLDSVWESVRAAERVVLDHTTIAQLAEQSLPHEWVI